MTGELYAQAGYVGGRYATPFVDGQARIDRGVADVGPATLRAGAGAWGGAQKGAARLDIGPSVSVSLQTGRVHSRMAVDYRIRVAGDARPATGPALTISAGF
jgi:urocanate hydratase